MTKNECIKQAAEVLNEQIKQDTADWLRPLFIKHQIPYSENHLGYIFGTRPLTEILQEAFKDLDGHSVSLFGTINDEDRQEVIKELYNLKNRTDDYTKICCVSAMRTDKPEDKQSAKNHLAKSDGVETAVKLAVDLINARWPRKGA